MDVSLSPSLPFSKNKSNLKKKKKPTERKDIFANDTSDGGLLSKIYKDFTTQHLKNNPI